MLERTRWKFYIKADLQKIVIKEWSLIANIIKNVNKILIHYYSKILLKSLF